MLSDAPLPSDEGLDAARLFAAGPEALIALRGGVVVLANARAVELVGHDPTGTEVSTVVEGWREEPANPMPFEAVLRRADGSELPVEVRTRRADGEIQVASLRDARALIAGRRAEAALTEAEAKYRSLVEQIPAVVYADTGDVTTYVSPQIRQILGVTPEEYRADPDLWLRMVHPDDRAAVEAESEAFIAGAGGDLADYRMVRPDGRVVWIRDRAYAFRDEEGRALWEHGILFDVTELKEAEARVAHMAFHDGLTGLANRQLFEETLTLAVERSKRDATAAAVLFLDLDNFKIVNDTMGHHTGDALLVALAQRLRSCTRETDLVARQGGDEFLMLLADLRPSEADDAVHHVIERVFAALAEPFELNGASFVANGSMGVSLCPRDADEAETLMKHADIAMYRAKREGRGGHAVYEPSDGP